MAKGPGRTLMDYDAEQVVYGVFKIILILISRLPIKFTGILCVDALAHPFFQIEWFWVFNDLLIFAP